MKSNIILFLCISLSLACQDGDKANSSELLGNDYRLFKNTRAWTLAKAVQDGNTTKIKNEVVTNKINPDFREPKFGNTLLMLAIMNSNFASAKALLQLGSDPNLGNTYRGTSAMIEAAEKKDARFLRLLLKYNGDPNSIERGSKTGGDIVIANTLISAIRYLDDNSLERVKILVEAGADINYYNENHIKTPLSKAILSNNMDVALYLLEKGANYHLPIYTQMDGHKVYILEALRKCLMDINSETYNNKLDVISFLKYKGLDYGKEPVPETIKKEIVERYPKTWAEYLTEY